MKLQTNEKIIKVYHHHALFFFWRTFKVWGASFAFYFVYYLFRDLMPLGVQVITVVTITVIFLLVNIYDFLMYYLDTLIVTTQRVVHLDWINPFKYLETQAMLDDIENIESQENGFLSKLWLFDFGEFLIETASTRTVVSFEQAPDPEGIKYFVTNLSRKQMAQEIHKVDLVTDAYKINHNTESSNSKVAS